MEISDLVTITDLCQFLGISGQRLRFYRFAKTPKKFKCFEIPKKTGGKRTIYCPIGKLKEIHQFLRKKIEPYAYLSSEAHGFIKDRSIKTNAEKHKGKNVLINLDVSNFFESIHIGRIIGLFTHKPFYLPNTVAVAIAQIICMDGRLIQGSPISPLLSNMIFYTIDRKLTHYVKYKSITYTRYADDITFSFNNKKLISLFFTQNSLLNPELENIFSDEHFSINQSKTRIQTNNMHQQVTGIKVNSENSLNVNNSIKYKIRGCLNAIKKHGISKAAKRFCEIKERPYDPKNSEKSEKRLVSYLMGMMSFYSMVRGKENPIYCKLALEANIIFDKRLFYAETNDYKLIVDNSILLIDANDTKYSTAFFYKNYIVTCCHSILDITDGDKRVFMSNRVKNTSYFIATAVKVDSEHDIAILKPESIIKCVNIKRSDDLITKEETIKIIGYPDYDKANSFDFASLTGHTVTERKSAGITFWTTDMPIQEGLSGGPVLSNKNEVIGMLVYGCKLKGRNLDNGFVDIGYIELMIKELENRDKINSKNNSNPKDNNL